MATPTTPRAAAYRAPSEGSGAPHPGASATPASEPSLGLAADPERLRRLAELGILAGGMAHQMNNMLMSIVGQAELLLRGSLAPEQRATVEAIIQAAQD